MSGEEKQPDPDAAAGVDPPTEEQQDNSAPVGEPAGGDGPETSAAPKEEETKDEQSKEQEPKLSKNQLKKIKRWERKMEVKKRRKQQEKDARHAKAKAQGRDIEQERKEMAKRTASGEGKRRRQAKWDEKFSQASSSFQVCIDCSFEKEMNAREINSLAQQLRYCYATNKRSKMPCHLAATDLGGETLQHLQNVSGFNEWSGYGFLCSTAPLNEHFQSKLSSSNVVYLTSDSEHVLETPEADKVYVIGGIVDRNRLKGATLQRAKALGVATARLPLDEHLQAMESTRVLTVNHVFDILVKFKECKDWKQALQSVLPGRKKATFVAPAADGEEAKTSS